MLLFMHGSVYLRECVSGCAGCTSVYVRACVRVCGRCVSYMLVCTRVSYYIMLFQYCNVRINNTPRFYVIT